MKLKYFIISICLCFFVMGCTLKEDQSIIYQNTSWIIKNFNDSTLLIIPNTTSQKPYLLNTKDFIRTNENADNNIIVTDDLIDAQ